MHSTDFHFMKLVTVNLTNSGRISYFCDSASFVKKWTGIFTAGFIDWSLADRQTLAIALFLTFLLIQKLRSKPFVICLLSLSISALEKCGVRLLWRLCIKQTGLVNPILINSAELVYSSFLPSTSHELNTDCMLFCKCLKHLILLSHAFGSTL